MTAIFIYPPELEKYHYPGGHPMVPGRTKITLELCRKHHFFRDEAKETATSGKAAFEEMAVFHDRDYLNAIRDTARRKEYDLNMMKYGLGTGDCPVFSGLYDYCAVTAGSTLAGTRLLAGKKADIAFAPAGGFHHAFKGRAEGFCYVNDCVLGIKDLLANGFERVAYIDLDAHHGNGVQDAFYKDNNVLTVSIHETGHTLYPGSGFEDEIGTGAGKGFNVNLPMPAQTDDDAWSFTLNEVVPPLLRAFKPSAILTQLGGDGLSGDPLTHMQLTNNGYISALKMLKRFCVPWIIVGGGGYNVEATTRMWALAWSVANGTGPEEHCCGDVGGVFKGSTEAAGSGLYDMHVYTTGPQKEEIWAHCRDVVHTIKKSVFPIHKIEEIT
jgi:acetoin utilization protein AcuC